MPKRKGSASGLDMAEVSQLLDSKLQPLQSSIDDIKAQLADMLTKAQVTAIVEQATSDLVTENRQLKEKLLQLENQSRRNNLRFSGLPEKADAETWADCETAIQGVITALGLDSSAIVIERAHRLGSKAKATTRPIIARFLSFKDREMVLQKYRQKETRTTLAEGIRILEDYPPEIDFRRSKLLPYFFTARHLKVPCKLAVDKLTINKETYTIDNIDNIPDTYAPQHTKDIDDSTIAFYRQESPLSNFHHAMFSSDGHTFTSVEQFYHYKKAELFEDTDLADAILKTADNPSKVKSMARKVKNFDGNTWRQEHVRIMKEGLRCKFQQNPGLKAKLSATRNKKLVEASPYDKYWGAGLSLHDPKLKDQTQWPGKNKLGDLLCDLRKDICG